MTTAGAGPGAPGSYLRRPLRTGQPNRDKRVHTPNETRVIPHGVLFQIVGPSVPLPAKTR
jgi:hypothetical protein